VRSDPTHLVPLQSLIVMIVVIAGCNLVLGERSWESQDPRVQMQPGLIVLSSTKGLIQEPHQPLAVNIATWKDLRHVRI